MLYKMYNVDVSYENCMEWLQHTDTKPVHHCMKT